MLFFKRPSPLLTDARGLPIDPPRIRLLRDTVVIIKLSLFAMLSTGTGMQTEAESRELALAFVVCQRLSIEV
jgi:hypothetical protein